MQTAREEERQRNTRQREQPGLSAGPHRRQDRWTRTCRPAPTHAPGRGWAGASHLLDGAQRVRVLLLRLLDLSQAAAPLVILCHLGLRPGRTGWCWGAPRTGTGGHRAPGKVACSDLAGHGPAHQPRSHRDHRVLPGPFLRPETLNHPLVGPVTCLQPPTKENCELFVNEKCSVLCQRRCGSPPPPP